MFCNSLLIIYKSFIKPSLDQPTYITYDQPIINQVFSNKLENVQYNGALPITESI